MAVSVDDDCRRCDGPLATFSLDIGRLVSSSSILYVYTWLLTLFLFLLNKGGGTRWLAAIDGSDDGQGWRRNQRGESPLESNFVLFSLLSAPSSVLLLLLLRSCYLLMDYIYRYYYYILLLLLPLLRFSVCVSLLPRSSTCKPRPGFSFQAPPQWRPSERHLQLFEPLLLASSSFFLIFLLLYTFFV